MGAETPIAKAVVFIHNRDMVALHTPFEYDPADDETRRVERARLSFKPSRELSDKLVEFILPSKRRQALGLHGLFLYSNHSWDVHRSLDGELEPQDALMEQEFERIRQEMHREHRKMKLSRFVVFKEVNPPGMNKGMATVVSLKVSLGQEFAQNIYDNDQIPNELLSRDTVPVHIAFPGDIAIPSRYNAAPKAGLERFVFGHPVSSAETIGAGVSPNANASVTSLKLVVPPRIRD